MVSGNIELIVSYPAGGGNAGESPFEAEQITLCEFPPVFCDLSSPTPTIKEGSGSVRPKGKGIHC